ncbi:MAG: chemotaxis response regulator protein-glutamate methylesterase [Granulosicoccus sp.]
METKKQRLKVLIVDDSEALCFFLRKVISSDPDLEVVGYALDAYEARDKIKSLQPDILTLDIEMPRMDGITFLKNLMRLRPMPVVMISSLTSAGAEVTLDALDIGAVDFVVKRHPQSEEALKEYCEEIVRRVKQAGKINFHKSMALDSSGDLVNLSAHLAKVVATVPDSQSNHRIIAIGSSTGGPDALKQLLRGLHAPDYTLLFAQHMPETFMESFAARLDSWSSFDISLANSNEPILPGRGYVAPGDHHLELINSGNKLCTIARKTDSVNGHRPSVDVLFNSVAGVAPTGAVGILLTGMGGDGALGLKAMRKAGGLTIIQDKKSSAVWGMPGRAHELDAADGVISLRQIGPSVSNLLSKVA